MLPRMRNDLRAAQPCVDAHAHGLRAELSGNAMNSQNKTNKKRTEK